MPLHSLLKSVLCLVSLAALELRLKDGAHHCEGRVEAKYQGEWGSAYTEYWHLISADMLCRYLECGPAVDAPRGSYFGPRLGPIWYFYYFCNITEAELSLAINKCVRSDFKNYNDTFSHDEDVGAVCSGKFCLLWEGIPSRKDLSLISRMTLGKPDHRLQSILGGRLQAHNDFRALCAQGGVKACLAL